MEEEPDLTPAEATKKAMTPDHRADHRDLARAAVGVRADRLHPRHLRHAVPAVRGHDQRRHADLGDQRADAFARAVRRVPPPHRAAARHHWAACCAGSTTCATATPPSCAGWCGWRSCRVVLIALCAGGIFGLAPRDADRLPSRRGSGRVLHLGPASRRRLGRTHARPSWSRSRSWCARCPRYRAAVHRRVLAAGRRQPVELGLPGRQAQAVRRPHGGDGKGASRYRPCVRRIAAGPQANAFPFNLPPIIGLSTSGGFEYQLQNLEGARSRRRWERGAGADRRRPTRTRGSRACSPPSRPPTRRSTSTSTARRRRRSAYQSSTSSPRCRPRWAASTSTTSTCSGAFGRSTSRARSAIGAISPTCSRSMFATTSARWCRCSSIAQTRIVLGPQVISRYNNYRSVTINGGPKPGVSSGDALAAMAQISAKTLPAGYSFEWTGHRLSGDPGIGQTGAILGLAVLFAYLFLVALYESWVIPIPVLLSVTVGVLGSVRRHPCRRSVARSLRADRSGGADRARRQEWHPDRRIRQGSARGRACRSARRPS